MGGCCGKGAAPSDADKTPYSQAKRPRDEPAKPGKEPASTPATAQPVDEETTERPPSSDQVQAAEQVSAKTRRQCGSLNYGWASLHGDVGLPGAYAYRERVVVRWTLFLKIVAVALYIAPWRYGPTEPRVAVATGKKDASWRYTN